VTGSFLGCAVKLCFSLPTIMSSRILTPLQIRGWIHGLLMYIERWMRCFDACSRDACQQLLMCSEHTDRVHIAHRAGRAFEGLAAQRFHDTRVQQPQRVPAGADRTSAQQNSEAEVLCGVLILQSCLLL